MMLDKLMEIFSGLDKYICHNEIGDSSIIPYLVKSDIYKVIIYGSIQTIFNIYHWLKSESVEPLYVIQNESYNDNLFSNELNVLKIEDLKKRIGA